MTFLNPKINLKKYWKKKIDTLIWQKKPNKIIEKKNNRLIWFPDGKLNVYENCIANRLNEKKPCIIFVDQNNKILKLTAKEIDHKVNYLSNKIIKLLGKNFRNKKIIIHSSASLLSTISILACCKLGIHFSVVFEDLEEKAILNRINLFKPSLIISRQIKKNFFIKFKKIKLIKRMKFLFLNEINFNIKTKIIIPSYKNNSDRNLFTLFTSGSTGQPKGIVHSSGGYLMYSKFTTHKQFGVNKKTIFLTASDAGWINGHTYSLFGPLTLGATTIILESPMLLLRKEILMSIIKLKVSIIYLPVTLIRLMKSIYVNFKINTKDLKTLGSMGEPLAPSVAKWYSNFFSLGKKSIINTYFQTETGGIVSSPNFKETVKNSPHGSVGKPVSKFINFNNLNSKKPIEINIKDTWPGIMKGVINGQNFFKNYFNKQGNFRLFDLATKYKNNIYIHGRVDDVINIRGHRIGSAELEAIVLKNKNIKECSAISIKDELEGGSFVLFIVGKEKKINEYGVKKSIFSSFGSFALPKKIFYIENLPKTRSGKILRRVLRDIYENPKKNNLKDLSTILDKSVIEKIKFKILNAR